VRVRVGDKLGDTVRVRVGVRVGVRAGVRAGARVRVRRHVIVDDVGGGAQLEGADDAGALDVVHEGGEDLARC
jgi:hypothetical protein